jgi:hypothetical protein
MGTKEQERKPVRHASFVCEGEYWTLGFEDRLIRLRDSRGLRLIALLLREPGREFHVLDLGTRIDPREIDARASRIDPEDKLIVRSNVSEGGGEPLDPQARAEYKQRLVELSEELEEAREFRDEERIARIEDEVDLVTHELTLRRSGKAASSAEQARINVTKNITRALSQIETKHKSLGTFLKSTVKTGIFCSYQPDQRFPVSWKFEADESPDGTSPTWPDHHREGSPAELLRELAKRNPLVGRELERRAVRRLLAQVGASHCGALALVAGAPGVGKTRLIAEIAIDSQWSDVLLGRCYEQGGVPHQPFIEILESILDRARGPEDLRTLVAEDGPELTRLLPSLRRVMPGLQAPVDTSPEHARRLMFEAFCNLLARRIGRDPALIVIEDLHWADESTLSLLLHVARRLPQLRTILLGSYRDSDLDISPQFAKALDDLLRAQPPILALTGLSSDGVAQMMENLSGRTPPPRLVATVFRETGGNPFFVGELIRYLEQENRLYDSSGHFRTDLDLLETDVPASVRLVVGRRLARLSDATQRILPVAAVLGSSFTFDLLQASTEEEMEVLMDLAEEAQASGLVAVVAGTRLEFSHELVRQAVLSRLSLARIERLHLTIADAIERLHADALEDHAAEIALHLRRASGLADPNRTIKFMSLAAERAFLQGALKEAEGAYRDALELLLTLPESAERGARELKILSALSVVLHYAKGYGAPERAEVTARARKLAEERGDSRQLYFNFVGSWQVALGRGDYNAAKVITEQTLELAQLEDSRLHDTEAGIDSIGSRAEIRRCSRSSPRN